MTEVRPTQAPGARAGRIRRVKSPMANRPPLPRGAALARAMVGVVFILLIAFVLEVAVFGSLRQARAQAIAHQQLRSSMAKATVPVGQLDNNGQIVALGTPIASLKIPALGLDETVLEGTTAEVLANGPGHRRDSPYPGQPGTSLIFGRQAAYGGEFAEIDQLRRGDPIFVTTGQGTQRFVVTGVRHANDKATATPGQARLSLVSASGIPFMPSSTVWVDASLAGSPVDPGSRVFSKNSLSPAEQAMAGDMGAALSLFLWVELLLAGALAMTWLRKTWGRWQSYLVGVPVIGLCLLQTSHQVAMLLPNLF